MKPDQQTITKPIRFCAEPVLSEQLALITQIVTHCGGLSRAELSAESGPKQGLIKACKPVSLRRVSTEQERRLFREVIERHHALSLMSHRLVSDWEVKYPIEPIVLEKLVDTQGFSGVCYRGANGLELRQTSGRGHQDTKHPRHGASPKRLLIYPLRADARESVRGDGGR